ncbi:MAG: M23 family metallopeptidase [Fibrobacteres bacterium]|nr:M23 family metallopeptidase [Fibrobacterota bacterium]
MNVAVVFFLFLGVQLYALDSIPWPIPCEPAMTSAFGDYRSFHFHSGLDIKTWGVTGYPVIAEENGYVSRIGVSVKGFGLALYVNHADGTMRVYGHLERFNDVIHKYVRSAQYSDKSFSQQLYLKPSEITFKAGDTLCYTGESGAGAPHLHYEYRNANQQTINPFVKGLRGVKDTKSPIIYSISLHPMDTSSRVDGKYARDVYPLTRDKGDTFTTSFVPDVWGRVGVGIREIDKADAAANRFNARTLRLYVDEELYHETVRDSFYFTETRLIDVDYDLLLNITGRGPHASLYVDDANTLSFYGGRKVNDGILNFGPVPAKLAAGEHRIKVEAVDYWGNTAVGLLKVKTDTACYRYVFPTDTPNTESAASIKDFALSADRGVILLSATGLKQPAKIRLEFNDSSVYTYMSIKNGLRWHGHVKPPFSGSGVLTVSAATGESRVLWKKEVLFLSAGDSGTLYSEDSCAMLGIEKGDLPHCQLLWFESYSPKPKKGEIVAVSKAYIVRPHAVFTEKTMKISIKSAGKKGGGVYTLGGKGRWGFTSGTYDSNIKAYFGKIRRPSVAAVCVDNTPPDILFAVPSRNGGRIEGRFLVVKVRDRGAGIGSDKNIVATIDGKWTLSEYDYESDRVKIELPEDIASGKHILRIAVGDNAGNSRSKSIAFIK